MSKAERTRAFIIEKSAPVFNKKGYAGTSLTDILEVTGLTKGALYGNFKDKNDIAIEAYKHNVAGVKKRYALYVDGERNAYSKLIAFTECYRKQWKHISQYGGCPVQNASIESDDSLDFLKPYVRSSIKSWAGYLSNIIEEGQKRKEFKTIVNSTDSAFSLIMVLEGGIMLSKIMNNEKFLFDALDRLVKMINEELRQ